VGQMEMKRKIMVRMWLMLIGATAFWGPVTLITLVTGKGHSSLVGTSLSTGFFLLSYLFVRRNDALPVKSVSGWMLAGVILLGGVFSSIAFTAMGAGFSGRRGWAAARWLLISLIPGWIALYGSVILGTLLGLLLVALFTIITYVVLERKSKSEEK